MIGYISDNLLLPILDFFYGLVPSYGLAIVALTVVIRLALFPLSAGSIRSARRMRIAQPVMQKRQAEIKARYSSDPQKQQAELGKLMKEFGSPLAGCLPLLVQMPILFALFATLRGSPFADVPYTLNLKVLPADQIAAVEPKPFTQALVIRFSLPKRITFRSLRAFLVVPKSALERAFRFSSRPEAERVSVM